MDHDVQFETEEQFWEELEDIVATPCRTHDRVDDTLRTWLDVATQYKDDYVHSEDDIARCSLTLLQSSLYDKHTDYVRRQLLHCLLQEDDAATLHLLAVFLLYDGKYHEQTFVSMTEEGSFPRLVQLIREGIDDEMGLHKTLVELMYEMSRIQEIAAEELATINDDFVLYLLQIVEGLADDDTGDPYHYPVIRVLLVLNEQYMVASYDPAALQKSTKQLSNKVIKVLSERGSTYKTFGENIIYLLNREGETSCQLLILKLLYLMFTTRATQEYFYTNDLHVLVDILIRNLLDLPTDDSSEPATPDTPKLPSSPTSLRHTYLRVLHPLLAHTQLRNPPHYKRLQLRNTLFLLADATHNHFSRPDETTVRLVGRCINVSWLRDEEDIELAIACATDPNIDTAYAKPNPSITLTTPDNRSSPNNPSSTAPISSSSSKPTSNTSKPRRPRPTPPPPRPLAPRALSGIPGLSSKPYRTTSTEAAQAAQRLEQEVRSGQVVVAKKLLGMGLLEGGESATSLVEMAALKELPGVMAPSRARNRRDSEGGLGIGSGVGTAGGDDVATKAKGKQNQKQNTEDRLLETLRGEHDPRGGGEGGHRLPLTLRDKNATEYQHQHEQAGSDNRHLTVSQTHAHAHAHGHGHEHGHEHGHGHGHGHTSGKETTHESEESSGGWSTASVSESESSNEYDSD